MEFKERGGIWFCTYLHNRCQQVYWRVELWEQQSITVGVPQGPILEPLLFTICVNDLPEALNEQTEMYAVYSICE